MSNSCWCWNVTLHCDQGEQLYNTPFGFGICGCRSKPQLHIRLSGRCYSLYSQGPCAHNQTLHWIPSLNQHLCVPTICPLGRVLSPIDGQCHILGTKGIFLIRIYLPKSIVILHTMCAQKLSKQRFPVSWLYVNSTACQGRIFGRAESKPK